MANGEVTITELEQVSSVSETDVFAVDTPTQTKGVPFSQLRNQILGNITGLIEERLTVNVDNLSEVGRDVLTNLPFPSDDFIELELQPTRHIYEAPDDGYVTISKFGAANNQYLHLVQVISEEPLVFGVSVGDSPYGLMSNTGQPRRWFLPVRKGSKFGIYYNMAGTTDYFRFVPAAGHNIEIVPGDLIIESSNPRTLQVNIKHSGRYALTLCGAGGGGGGSAGSHAWVGSYGGSAAAFDGTVQLEAGYYNLTIGAAGKGGAGSGRNALPGGRGGDSTFTGTTELIKCGGGIGGNGTGDYAGSGRGLKGVLTMGALDILEATIQSDGADRSSVSVLGNGFGAGGISSARTSGKAGTNGYVKLVYLGE